MTSKYVAFFLEEVSGWQRKLSTANAVIAIWFDVQRTWSHLESIFIGSDDIRAQLPQVLAKETLPSVPFPSQGKSTQFLHPLDLSFSAACLGLTQQMLVLHEPPKVRQRKRKKVKCTPVSLSLGR